MGKSPLIVGWKSIAAHVAEVTGLAISHHQAQTLARRREDPLPTFPIGRGRRRPRGVRKNQLEAWVKREYAEIME